MRLRALATGVALFGVVLVGPAAVDIGTADADAESRSGSGTGTGTESGAHRGWTTTWSTAQHHPIATAWGQPNWSLDGFTDQSVRQIVRVGRGGTTLRIRLSNAFGSGPLRISGATVAKAGAGAALRPETLRPLTFRHRPSTTIPGGARVASDAVRLRTSPLDRLTVTVYFARATGAATFHEGGLTTTYRADGDHRYDPHAEAFTGETSHSWYFLDGVDVSGESGSDRAGTVVALGDSITDGAISTPNADNRYPDELNERLVAAGSRLGVANEGINGNKLLSDSTCFGEAAVRRFERDVLDNPRVRSLIVLIGINDIGSSGQPDQGCGASPEIDSADLIEGHRALIRAAHRNGIKAIGATLLPCKGDPYGYYTEEHERIRDELNHWIRTSGEYDAVVDLDRALSDPDDPDAMLPAYAAEDKLHPNDRGMKAMAAAVDLSNL